jgi:hexosaminidase
LLWTAAYSVDERYTQADVKAIVEYARQRGVRVTIEIDSPGHASSMCKGYPSICCTGYCGNMDPSKDATYNLFDGLFSEITGRKQGGGLFPDDFLHLGGDEVNTDCWNNDPTVAAWMKANNMTATDAFYYYVNRTQHIAISQSRTPINWEEVYDNFGTNLTKETVLQTWYYWDTAQKAVADGYRVIWSNGWYLGSQGQTWQGFYGINPVGGIDPSNLHLFLGGEACMWGELVDPSSLFNTVWPTAAAMSERLWSASTVTDVTSATPRYEWFRCLLLSRGINAAPSTNTYYHMPPAGPGSCWYQ